MVYNYCKKNIIYLFGILIFSIAVLVGCGDHTASPEKNYYIELVGFNDSIGVYLTNSVTGKVAYYKDDKLELISGNYLTEKDMEFHNLNNFTQAPVNFTEGNRKIRVEQIGLYPPDSVRYALQKFVYKQGSWIKVSDMGTLKAVTTYKKGRQFYVSELGKQIVQTIAEYTFQ